jgi:hypothetical protein
MSGMKLVDLKCYDPECDVRPQLDVNMMISFPWMVVEVALMSVF